MRLGQLVNHWEQHARGRLADEQVTVRLPEEGEKRLEALARQYPLKSREALLRDLISAALTDLEVCFPYREGSRVVARDEDGFEIYEDAGMTPRFLNLSRKYMQQLKGDASRVA
ncbi:ribbon-helix-helix protein, CopG family [Vreelandella utahensis]|uniref:ribbon-helix-helix protein, CopG family n=1 Tax=Vreelandella halophila TaxID=86177 RepID=UPI000987584B|nr:ribbon-helix-helix protein, CopG family [Halomonas utahensis]